MACADNERLAVLDEDLSLKHNTNILLKISTHPCGKKRRGFPSIAFELVCHPMDSPIEPHKVDLGLDNLPQLDRSPLRLVLDNVRSAHNTGALLRTADACCVDFVYLVGTTPHPPQAQLEKTALGATKYVPWKYRAKFSEVLEELGSLDYTLVALDNGPGAVDLWELPWPKRTALVAGNEVDGVSQEVLDTCSLRVNIPMFGYKRSLNVTTALGIAMYEYLRTFRSGQG